MMKLYVHKNMFFVQLELHTRCRKKKLWNSMVWYQNCGNKV